MFPSLWANCPTLWSDSIHTTPLTYNQVNPKGNQLSQPFKLLVMRMSYLCLISEFFVTIRYAWEKGISIEELLSPVLSMGILIISHWGRKTDSTVSGNIAGKLGLGYIRKTSEQASKQHSSIIFAWVPALNSLCGRLWTGSISCITTSSTSCFSSGFYHRQGRSKLGHYLSIENYHLLLASWSKIWVLPCLIYLHTELASVLWFHKTILGLCWF